MPSANLPGIGRKSAMRFFLYSRARVYASADATTEDLWIISTTASGATISLMRRFVPSARMRSEIASSSVW